MNHSITNTSFREQAAPGRAGAAVAAAAAPFAGWEIDLPSRATWWSAQACALFGLPPGSTLSVEETSTFCVPEQRALLAARIDACISAGTAFEQRIDVVGASGRRAALCASGRALRIGAGPLIRIQGAFQELAANAPAHEESPRLADTLDNMSEAFYALDSALRFTYLNPEAARLLHRDRSALLGKLIWDEFSEAIGGQFYHHFSRALREHCSAAFEEYYRPLGAWFEVRSYPTDDGLAVYFHDITERKAERSALRQANRALQMLSRCNHLVMHATQERDLIEEVCRIAVEAGGYRLAWVGYTGGEQASIAIAAHAGDPDLVDCLRSLPPGWSEDSPAGRGPAWLAVRSGAPVIVEDMAHDPRFSPAAREAACGAGGAVYLPLRDGRRAFGLLALHGHAAAGADPREIGLLRELADNLGFGIGTLRARIEQDQLQAAVSRIAASVSNATDEHFFEQLAGAMAEAAGADGGFVARLRPTDPPTARTVIAVLDGVRLADLDYPVAGAPCALALDCGHYVVPAGADALFPNWPGAALGVKAYAGLRLSTSAGAPIGIAAVLFRAPLPRSDFVMSTLRIFAARAAAELERQDADAGLRTQASLLDNAQDAIILRDLDDRLIFWNKSAERLYGWTREEALGQNMLVLAGGDAEQFVAARQAAIATGNWTGEVHRRAKDGSPVIVQVRLSLIRNDAGEAEALLSINTDISQHKAAEREIERLAFFDPVTALPNRLLLLDRLQHALTVTARNASGGALLFIDLDNFKAINDTLGHDRGDQMLQQIGQRLRGCVYESDTVARFGGDEFVVLIENLSPHRLDAAGQARHVCEKVAGAFAEPFMLDQVAHYTTASIGVTLFDPGHDDPGELLRQADMAMYEVKAAGRNGVRFFDPEMQAAVTARTELEADLRGALQRDEFVLYYQPQIDRDGLVSGAEALIRWQSPARGLVAPAQFIPLAEATGLIVPIGRWVLEQASAQLARWSREPGMEHLGIAVNVSARQLRQPAFVEEVLNVLERAGAAPHRLKIEITETLLVDDAETAIATMCRLKAHQVCFSLDDFGTGYSSLSYLKRLPLDQIKIDQSFVSEVLSDRSDAAIIQTILALGGCLGMFVIAEGVETAEQHAYLTARGCHAFQGHLFSRPVPVARFEELARQRGMRQGPDSALKPGTA